MSRVESNCTIGALAAELFRHIGLKMVWLRQHDGSSGSKLSANGRRPCDPRQVNNDLVPVCEAVKCACECMGRFDCV